MFLMKGTVKNMNPLLAENCFMPDAEARVMPDGRLYLYGSWDISGSSDYCSCVMHCFSTDDMENWTDHGIIFRNDEKFHGIPWNQETRLYAPDAIEKDGKYYLYVCGSHKEEGVSVAESPIGPFPTAQKIDFADGDGIDPSVFIDDDGQAYLFWGQFSLRGAKLAPDMKTIIPESIKKEIITEWEHGFHEGASIRRRGNRYYMVYTDISRGKATCMSYAVADSPLGPYKKGGVIIDNIYCDPNTWNNHGSIAEFNGQWYVFYHRSSQGMRSCRRVCAEPISFDENGWIREVEQTSQGASAPMNARHPIRARRTCRMIGTCRVEQIEDREVLASHSGGHWGMSDWAEYKYINFDEAGFSKFHVLVKGKGSVTLKVDGGCEISSVSLDRDTFAWESSPCENIRGIRALWVFLQGDLTVEEFFFE